MAWGEQQEVLLQGRLLRQRLDTQKVPSQHPVDIRPLGPPGQMPAPFKGNFLSHRSGSRASPHHPLSLLSFHFPICPPTQNKHVSLLSMTFYGKVLRLIKEMFFQLPPKCNKSDHFAKCASGVVFFPRNRMLYHSSFYSLSSLFLGDNHKLEVEWILLQTR